MTDPTQVDSAAAQAQAVSAKQAVNQADIAPAGGMDDVFKKPEPVGLTSSMLQEEEQLVKESEQEEQKLHQREHEEVAHVLPQERSRQQDALNTLVTKASIYAQFIEQQFKSRQEKEERERQLAEKRAAKKDQAAAAAQAKESTMGDGKRSTRGGGAEKTNSAKKDAKATRTRGSKRKAADIEAEESKTEPEAPTEIAPDDDGVEDRYYNGELLSERQPKLITGCRMRNYQLDGMEWMVSLWENGLNGILGDEMGLGKTLQCISFIAYLTEKKVPGPFLIVGPLSTIQNWVNEFKKFAPSLNVLLYHGTAEEREALRIRHGFHSRNKDQKSLPIVVTSFEITMRDRKHFQNTNWKYIILDEGHRIKNLNCRLIQELKSYNSVNRLLLTGTPLQNNLSELWSLLNFLMPEIFDNLDNFQKWFDFDNDIGDDEGDKRFLAKEMESQLLRKLHGILKPFLLRRLKTDVEEYNLPHKKEIALYTKLTPRQEELYTATVKRDIELLINGPPDKSRSASTSPTESPTNGPRAKRRRSSVNYKEVSDREFFKNTENGPAEVEFINAIPDEPETPKSNRRLSQTNIKLNNIVMQLRKICNHPYLLEYPLTDSLEYRVDQELISSCGKFMLLDRLLPALKAGGHRVLIFSQMTAMLDILQDYCTYRGFNYCRLDGSTSQVDRQEQIESFNTDDDYFVFLLSTRAGGLGINLVSADTVIIYDSDWNPQVDLQAMDRCHRIGQTKPVNVYRLITRHSVENQLLHRAQAKRKLEKLVVHKGSFKGVDKAGVVLDMTDIRRLLDEKEQMEVWTDGEQVISDTLLAQIMDRSKPEDTTTQNGAAGNSVFELLGTEGGDITAVTE